MPPKKNTLTPKERVTLARSVNRPNLHDYIAALFDGFFETHGDRLFGDDPAILCGVAFFDQLPVTVAGHVKGHDLNENVRCRFGMPNPEGYRKFQRAARQAEKFHRPLITLIDTPGAYPGTDAEQRGQGEAIARCLSLLSTLKTPILAIVTGEGGSGGALALGVADRILMLENAIYSILSPEGFASILWKDAKRSAEACEVMKLTSYDLQKAGVADRIIAEPLEGIEKDPQKVMRALRKAIAEELAFLMRFDIGTLVANRYQKFRVIGS